MYRHIHRQMLEPGTSRNNVGCLTFCYRHLSIRDVKGGPLARPSIELEETNISSDKLIFRSLVNKMFIYEIAISQQYRTLSIGPVCPFFRTVMENQLSTDPSPLHRGSLWPLTQCNTFLTPFCPQSRPSDKDFRFPC